MGVSKNIKMAFESVLLCFHLIIKISIEITFKFMFLINSMRYLSSLIIFFYLISFNVGIFKFEVFFIVTNILKSNTKLLKI